jgi:hypothetical protein
MKCNEISAVMRQQRPALLRGKGQKLIVGYCRIRPSRIARSQHVMPELPQFLNHLQRYIFIGIKARH